VEGITSKERGEGKIWVWCLRGLKVGQGLVGLEETQGKGRGDLGKLYLLKITGDQSIEQFPLSPIIKQGGERGIPGHVLYMRIRIDCRN